MITVDIWWCDVNGWMWEVRENGVIVDAGASYTYYAAQVESETAVRAFKATNTPTATYAMYLDS